MDAKGTKNLKTQFLLDHARLRGKAAALESLAFNILRGTRDPVLKLETTAGTT